MNWFRSNIKQGSRLALLALAIQFGLSFGHFHPIAAPAAAGQSIQQQQLPSSDHDSDQSDDHCAICAVMALAGTALFATPPVLPLPQPAEYRYLAADASFVHLNAVRLAFQPRAPPLS
jgi:hypothetical protein